MLSGEPGRVRGEGGVCDNHPKMKGLCLENSNHPLYRLNASFLSWHAMMFCLYGSKEGDRRRCSGIEDDVNATVALESTSNALHVHAHRRDSITDELLELLGTQTVKRLRISKVWEESTIEGDESHFRRSNNSWLTGR